MYATLHVILVALYAVLPVAALGWALYRGRRHKAIEPVASFLVTSLSAVMLGTAVVIIYVILFRGRVAPLEVLRTWYFMLGLLCAVSIVRWAIREGAHRLVRPNRDASGKVARGFRTSVASMVQVLLLFAIGLPYVIGTMLVSRVRVTRPGETPGTTASCRDYEAVRFDATDGVSLAGWWVPADRLVRPALAKQRGDDFGAGTVILCGGLGDTLVEQAGLLRVLINDGYNVLYVSLRAHDGSGGHWTSFGDVERRDVLGAVRWLRATHPDECAHLFALGGGIGGAAVIAAAADPSDEGQAIDAVAVYGAYGDFAGVADHLLAARLPAPLKWWQAHVTLPIVSAHAGADLRHFSPADLAAQLWPRPILVLHGRGDVIFPPIQADELFRRATFPKRMVWLNADHAGAYRSRLGAGAVLRFFETARPVPAI